MNSDIIYFCRVNGLYVIQITDQLGVPILRVSQDLDISLMPSFIPTFTTASDQAGKLGLGRNKTIISMYNHYQVKGCIYFFFNFA